MLKHRRLFILCGVPGAGKSTWAKDFARQHKDTCVISRDAIRFEFLKQYGGNYFLHEESVFATFVERIQEAIDNSANHYVIADATHINSHSRLKLLNQLVLPFDVDVIPIVFDTSLADCLERNSQRQGKEHIPEHTIKGMYRSFTYPSMREYHYDGCYIMHDGELNLFDI